jgi:hypothetical protein
MLFCLCLSLLCTICFGRRLATKSYFHTTLLLLLLLLLPPMSVPSARIGMGSVIAQRCEEIATGAESSSPLLRRLDAGPSCSSSLLTPQIRKPRLLIVACSVVLSSFLLNLSCCCCCCCCSFMGAVITYYSVPKLEFCFEKSSDDSGNSRRVQSCSMTMTRPLVKVLQVCSWHVAMLLQGLHEYFDHTPLFACTGMHWKTRTYFGSIVELDKTEPAICVGLSKDKPTSMVVTREQKRVVAERQHPLYHRGTVELICAFVGPGIGRSSRPSASCGCRATERCRSTARFAPLKACAAPAFS